MRLKLCLLLLLCPFYWGFGQEKVIKNRTGLQVGDRVPDVVIGAVINYPFKTVKISDFKDKLLILDFLATTCGNCLEAMPAVAGLQRKYKDRMQVLEVDYEKAGYVSGYLDKHLELKQLGLPVAAGDTLLTRLFPHRFLPHMVWIRNGVFLGATEGDYLTDANISGVLRDAHFALGQREAAVQVDWGRPLFGFGAEGRVPLCSAVLTAYLPGLPLRAGMDTAAGVRRFYAVNHPVLNLFALALGSGLPFMANRRVLDLKDSAVILNVRGEYEDVWAGKHCYSFEGVVPLFCGKGQVMAMLRQQLALCLGFYGRIEKREVDCLVLYRAGTGRLRSRFSSKSISMEMGKPVVLHHIRMDDLAWVLNGQRGMPPVLDGSGEQVFFDLELPFIPTNASAWKTALGQQGILLRGCKKPLDMFVLSDKELMIKPILNN